MAFLIFKEEIIIFRSVVEIVSNSIINNSYCSKIEKIFGMLLKTRYRVRRFRYWVCVRVGDSDFVCTRV